VAITSTTITGATTAYTTQFAVGSTANITAPVSTTGSGMTLLYVEAEMMFVTGVPVSGTVQVIRGFNGTKALAHLAGVLVTIGTLGDFVQFTPQIGAFQVENNRFEGVSAPVAAAASITAPANIFHLTGVTATTTIVPPTNFVGGAITIIADGTWTWTSTTSANGIAQTGLVTSVGTAVTFFFDPNTALWYPSRRA
jgi:hypothetical protein